MLEERLSQIIACTENQISLVKIKLKTTKTELKQVQKIVNNKYLDNERVEKDIERLKQEISELDNRLYKLNKVLYRFRVCEKILNSKSE